MGFSALLVLVGAISLTATAQNMGDIRLTGYGATSTSGRVEVFYGDYGWGTVNYKSLDENFANVACQQLGYAKAVSTSLAIKTQYGIGNTTWILLNGSRCTGDEIHILRCYWRNLPCLRCSHDDDTAIECSSTSIWSSPYEGQVRLSGTLPSMGVAEVYVRGSWESICYDNVQSIQADSICRQLGYTDSKEQGTSRSYSNRSWLRSFNCTDAQPCFTYCFNRNSRSDDCSSGPLSLSCEFKLNGTWGSAGSPSICVIRDNSGSDTTSSSSCKTLTVTSTATTSTLIITPTTTTSTTTPLTNTPIEVAISTNSESPTVTCIPNHAKSIFLSLPRRTLYIILGSLGGVCCGLWTVCVLCCCYRRRNKRHRQKKRYDRYHSIR